MVQWLRVGASTAGGMGSIPGWETKIPHASQHRKKKTLEQWPQKSQGNYLKKKRYILKISYLILSYHIVLASILLIKSGVEHLSAYLLEF